MPSNVSTKTESKKIVIKICTKKTTDLIYKQITKLEKKIFPKHESLSTTICKEALKTGQQLLYAFKPHETEEIVHGYILIRRNSIVGHIDKIAVDPKYRRRGIGHQLLEVALQELRSTRVMSVTLNVDIENIHAIHLYQKFGFQIVSTRQDFYCIGRHAYQMELENDF